MPPRWLAMSTSVSLLKPAMPTAPTTSPPTRIGMPPRSAAMLAVTNAVRPRLMLSSISAVGRCSRAARSCLPDREVRACRPNTVHPLKSKQIPGRINHRDCRGRMALLCTCLRCLQNHLGPGLIEGRYIDGLCPGRKGRRLLPTLQRQFQVWFMAS